MEITKKNSAMPVAQPNTINHSERIAVSNPLILNRISPLEEVKFTGRINIAKSLLKPANLNRKTLKDLPSIFEESMNRVLVRVDHNVSFNQANDKIKDRTRIIETVPTFIDLLRRKAKITVMAHIGDPYKLDKKGNMGAKISTKITAEALQEEIRKVKGFENVEVIHIPHITGKEADEAQKNLKPNQILYLENVRFNPAETGKDAIFDKVTQKYKSVKVSQEVKDAHSKEIAKLGDYFVLEGFGVSHRDHISVINKHFQGMKVMGLEMAKEVKAFSKIISSPKRPYVAIIGGAKLPDKTEVADSLVNKILKKGDSLVIVGGMTNTFKLAEGKLYNKPVTVADSIKEEDQIDFAMNLIKTAKKKGIKLILGEDAVVTDSATGLKKAINPSNNIDPGHKAYDIGPKTIAQIEKAVGGAKTILWNGPAGVFEDPRFAEGTEAIARIIAKATKKGAMSVIGGGDTITAVNSIKNFPKNAFSFISTGGGAMLKIVAKKGKVPGVEAMDKRVNAAKVKVDTQQTSRQIAIA